VISGDIWCDWDVVAAPALAANLTADSAWLLMVDNPAHHPAGDFVLEPDGRVHDHGEPRLTYSGFGVYHPSLFAGIAPGTTAKLAPLLRQAMEQDKVRGARHTGRWTDVGTPQTVGRPRRAARCPPGLSPDQCPHISQYQGAQRGLSARPTPRVNRVFSDALARARSAQPGNTQEVF